jgi:hypothetical protein
MTGSPLSAEEARRLHELLPWYLNGSLSAESRQWVDALLLRSAAAAQMLQVEQNLARSIPSMLAPAPENIGLSQLMARVRAEGRPAQPTTQRAKPPRQKGWLAPWLDWLTHPHVALAMCLLVVAQFGVIGWLGSTPVTDARDVDARSMGVTELRTLRVTFKKEASQKAIQAALVGVGARIVGGPTILGEYWVASSSASLAEIRTALAKSGLVASMEDDPVGPRGH